MPNKILKIIVWRIISIIFSFLIAGFFLNSWHFAIGLVVMNSIILMTAQAIFEHLWELKFKDNGIFVKVEPLPKNPNSPEAAGNEFT